MKNTLEEINRRLGDTEECLSNLEYTIVKITQYEERKEKQIKKWGICDNIKCTNICIIGVTEVWEGERKALKMSDEIMVKIFLNLKVKFAQLCLTLYKPMDYTVHGILQARIMESVAIPFSRGSSQPRDWTQVSQNAGGFFTSWATREA